MTRPLPTLSFLLGISIAGAAFAAPPAAQAAPAPVPEATASGGGPDTPRGAVRAYLEACRAGEYAAAARFLDLAPVAPGQRDTRGPELAQQLKRVLDRTLWVDLAALSDAPEGDPGDGLPRQRDRVGRIESTSGPVEVTVDRALREGRPLWRFSAPLVARIPQLHEEFGYGPLGELLPPVFFELQVLEIQLWQWLALGILVVVAGALSWLVVRVLRGVAGPLVERSDSDLDDRLIAILVSPLRWAVALLIFKAALLAVGLSVPAQRFFDSALKAGAVIIGTWLLLRAVDLLSGVVERRLQRAGGPATNALVPVGRKTVKAVVVLLAGLATLETFGFDVTALIAGLGVGGLAVALAAQKTVENLFGGATVLADRPVRVGDFCRFGDRVGTVEEIGMRSTRIRTLDRTVVTVPNAEFASLQLENFGRRDKTWYHPTLGLRYETRPDQLRFVLAEIRQMLLDHENVHDDPTRVRFRGFGASSLDIEIFAYVRAPDWDTFLEVAEDLNLRVMDIVEAAGTGFAFPSTTAYLARDAGLDAEKARAAAERGARLREGA